MKKTFCSLLFVMSALVACAQEKPCCAEGTNSSDAVIKTIMTRTSIRQFEPRPVGADTIETLLRAGMAAPTAMNKQPWHFIVVTNREKLQAMGGRAAGAPLCILVCGDMSVAKGGPGASFDFWVQDCSAASENILLAAHALGLGAVWTGAYPTERSQKYRELLGLPEDIVPLNAIAIGFPAESPAPKDKWKPEKITLVK